MPALLTRIARLSRRGKVLLGVASAFLVIAIVAGGLLALNPSLAARLARILPGLTINGCTIQPETVCPDANLAGANLAGADLTRANLAGVNLANANLTGANLTNADLVSANLTGADLRGANLTGAGLYQTDLSGANLTGATLTGADLSKANLAGTNLSNTTLAGLNMEYANLSGALLSNANLSNARLCRASLQGAAMEGANMTGALLCETVMSDGQRKFTNCDGCLSHWIQYGGWDYGDFANGRDFMQVVPKSQDVRGARKCLSGSLNYYTQQWSCSDDRNDWNQQWSLKVVGDYMQARIRSSGWCLTAEGDHPGVGSTVIAFACRADNHANQLWHVALVDGSDGYYLVNKATSLCAVIKDNSADNGALAVLDECRYTDPYGVWVGYAAD